MAEAKPFVIDKWAVHNAFLKVKENKGSGGIDGISIEQYEKKLSMNLYKLWNRMSSGTYFPKPVKLVEIPKANGGTRPPRPKTCSTRKNKCPLRGAHSGPGAGYML